MSPSSTASSSRTTRYGRAFGPARGRRAACDLTRGGRGPADGWRGRVQTGAWISSFIISVLVSIIILQSLKAIMGGTLTTLMSTVVVGALAGAIAISADMMALM